MENFGRIVLRPRCNHYTDVRDGIEPLFDLFQTAADSTYRMSDIGKRARLPICILYHGREDVRHDAS
jgi:hypothetical protein